jgi:glycosyltransferase involved in cell wall biosynthesis
MRHAQNAALAILEAGQLDAYVTSFAWNPKGRAAQLLARLPGTLAHHAARHLSRREISYLPPNCVHQYPAWELVRTFCQHVLRDEILTDLSWDRLSHAFDAEVARHFVPRTQAIQAFEYTAFASFQRARELGVARILHLPSLDSRRFDEIQRRERSLWPELVGKHDKYFDEKFGPRYARRCAEVELADVIITNSPLTARSHIDAGADPDKIFPVLLGAPPAVLPSTLRPRSASTPLRVVWAGPFSLRKGAHYMLTSWRKLAPGASARLDVYGILTLPERLRAYNDPGIVFHGSVSQSDLFAAFLDADVLVFPTLSDGFGMVIAESFAHGLPVITTLEAGAASLVRPDNGLIVPAGDVDALADALRWCLDNRLKLQDMRLSALATARSHQWRDFRKNLICALEIGLKRRGYCPTYLHDDQ